MQRSALCRSRRELSNAYFVAKFGLDTAENEPCQVCPTEAFPRGRSSCRGRTYSYAYRSPRLRAAAPAPAARAYWAQAQAQAAEEAAREAMASEVAHLRRRVSDLESEPRFAGRNSSAILSVPSSDGRIFLSSLSVFVVSSKIHRKNKR